MKKGQSLAAIMAMALLASPDVGHQRAGQQLLPRAPRTRRNGMRRASVRPWCSAENERRRKQIERGVLTSASRGSPC